MKKYRISFKDAVSGDETRVIDYECPDSYSKEYVEGFFDLKRPDVRWYEIKEMRVCPLCGEEFFGYGNNPWPLEVNGQVCDKCNREKVIPARMKL